MYPVPEWVSVFSAGTAVAVVVVVAGGVRVVVQRTFDERLDLCVRVAVGSGVDLDACVPEHVPRSAADTSADERLDTEGFEVSCKRSVSESVVADDL